MYFISEVSSNHACDIERAYEFIRQSAKSGCNAVKFQLFKVEELFSKEVFVSNPEVLERKKWELPREFIPKLHEECLKNNIDFICTPFDLSSVKYLKDYVTSFKIASYELLWDDLLKECARTGKEMIISTGMATIEEIEHAVKLLRSENVKKLTILHCSSAYPTPFDEANLSAINTIRENFNCDVGWSDHTVNAGVLYRAIIKWNASIIEFHMDLDGKGTEYKSGHCWLPNEINEVIINLKNGIKADGDGKKRPNQSEMSDRNWRADPSDGLRPIKSFRKKLVDEK